MNEIEKLAQSIKNAGKRHVKINTAWAKVKSVNWSKKTMTATGVADDLDYFGVLLGLGYTYLKPKKGSLVLLGIIENKEAATFLIEAEEVEEVQIKCPKIIMNDGINKGLVNVIPLKAELVRVEANLNLIKPALAIALGFASATVDGGASITAYSNALPLLPIQDISQLEDTKVIH